MAGLADILKRMRTVREHTAASGLALTLTLLITGMLAAQGQRSAACGPPTLNVVRTSPFVVQGTATLPAHQRPLLPTNVDFRFDVLHADRVDAASFRLRADYPLKTEKEEPLRTDVKGTTITVSLRSKQPLRPGVGYSVYGMLAGKRQRVFQFQTAKAADRVAPSAVQAVQAVQIARFVPPGGLCEDGHARVLLTVAASDDQTREDRLRFVVEGAGEPQLLGSGCRRLEVSLDPAAPPARLRVTAVDLAGNRGPSTSVDIPPAIAGSWDVLRSQRECEPTTR